jgi:Spy/CpxP family protein refolding chaperone
MRLPLAIVGALLAAGGAAGLATAQTSPSTPTDPPAANGAGHHLSRIDRLAILLDLTDTQKLQVQQVLDEERQQMRAQWQQQRASGAKPDFRQLRAAMHQQRQQTLAKLQALLSADQFRKFQVLMTPRRGHRWHHRLHGAPGSASGAGSSSSSG